MRSRAARRGGTSPPPKAGALKSSTGESTDYQPWLHNVQSAGISKKKKSKPMSRQQRLRQQRGFENGERNLDKLEKKVADSKTRAKKVQARAKQWEELNEGLIGKENQVSLKKDDDKLVEDSTEARVEGHDPSDQVSTDVDMVQEVVEKMEKGEPALRPTRMPLPASDDVGERGVAEEESVVEAIDDIA